MMKHDMKIITSISPYQILQGTADVFLGVPCLRIVQSPLPLSPYERVWPPAIFVASGGAHYRAERRKRNLCAGAELGRLKNQ